MKIKHLQNGAHLCRFGRVDLELLLFLSQNLGWYSVKVVAQFVRGSLPYIRSRLNELHQQFPACVSKRKRGGSVPWHDQLGKRGAPVLEETVIQYLKKNHIKVTPKIIKIYLQIFWDEGKATGRWVPMKYCEYGWNEDYEMKTNGKTSVMLRRK